MNPTIILFMILAWQSTQVKPKDCNQPRGRKRPPIGCTVPVDFYRMVK